MYCRVERLNQATSSVGSPSNSAMIVAGSGVAMSRTRSASPCSITLSINSSTNAWTRGRTVSMARRVKNRLVSVLTSA